MRGVFTEFSRKPGGAVPLRSTAWRSSAALEGPEPDAKVETLWTERVLHVCLESDQGQNKTRTAALLSRSRFGPARRGNGENSLGLKKRNPAKETNGHENTLAHSIPA